MAKPLSDNLFTQYLSGQSGLAAIWRRVYHRQRQTEHVLGPPKVISPKTLALENQRTLRVRLAGRKRRESAAVRGIHSHLSPPTAVWPIVVYQKRNYIQVHLAGRTRMEMRLRGPHSRLRSPTLVLGSSLPIFSTVTSTGAGAAAGALAHAAPVLVHAPPWRFVVTTLHHTTLTFLDHIATNRSLVYTLNKPTTATGIVASDNPEVYIAHTDGDPFLAEGNRFLLGFRREGLDPKWVIRFAGIILQVEDAVDLDTPKTAFTAYDPWQYLYSRPCRQANGSLPGEAGMTFTADTWTGDAIVKALIDRTVTYDGTVHVNTGGLYYGGTMQNTGAIDFVVAQGTTVGEAITQLCDTGSLDVYFSPIYDPFNQPGILCNLNVFGGTANPDGMGRIKYDQIFGWDKPGRNLTNISRLQDGAQRKNVVQYFRTNSIPVGTVSDAASYAKYGKYWNTQTFQSDYPADAVELLAAEDLLVNKDRPTTIRVTPAPEISPVPFVEYFLGDQVQIVATKRLRQPLHTLARIYSIPIDINDNSVETVTALEFSADSLTAIDPGPSIPPVDPTPVEPGLDVAISGGTDVGDTLSVIITA